MLLSPPELRASSSSNERLALLRLAVALCCRTADRGAFGCLRQMAARDGAGQEGVGRCQSVGATRRIRGGKMRVSKAPSDGVLSCSFSELRADVKRIHGPCSALGQTHGRIAVLP